MIIEGLKKRLYDENSKKGGKWIHELPHVIWGIRTQPSKAIGQIPFFLVYGSEAILLADIMCKVARARLCQRGSLHCSCSVGTIPTGDPTISQTQRQRTVVQYRRFGPTPHPRRVRITQAQFEMGRTVHHQADYKTGVLSTIILRGPRRPKFLERTKPVKALPIRRREVIAVLRAPRRFPFDSIWRPCATESGM
jgi:hypothetical protein